MISSASYFLLFTLLPTIIYAASAYAVIAFERLGSGTWTCICNVSIMLLMAYDFIAFKYFKRQYRRHFSSFALSNWPYFCCILLIILDSAILRTWYKGGTVMFPALELNLLLPMILLPLPIIFKAKFWAGCLHLFSGLCLYACVMILLCNLGWAGAVLQCLAGNQGVCLSPFCSARSAALGLLFGGVFYICHGVVISRINSKMLRTIFSRKTKVCLSILFLLHLAVLGMSFKYDQTAQLLRGQLVAKHGCDLNEDAIRSKYLGSELPSADFWKSLEEASGEYLRHRQSCLMQGEVLGGVECHKPMTEEQAAEADWEKPLENKMLALLDSLPAIPKCDRQAFGSEDVPQDLTILEAISDFLTMRIVKAANKKDAVKAYAIFYRWLKIEESLQGDILPLAEIIRLKSQNAIMLHLLNNDFLKPEQLLDLMAIYEKREPKIQRFYDGVATFVVHNRLKELDALRTVNGLQDGIGAPCLSVQGSRWLFPLFYDAFQKCQLRKLDELLHNDIQDSDLYKASIARNRILLTALATAIFTKEKGRMPNEISELMPDYLPSLPMDPFSTEPLHWENQGKSIWSVGNGGIGMRW